MSLHDQDKLYISAFLYFTTASIIAIALIFNHPVIAGIMIFLVAVVLSD